ncbi:hypothetical protein BN946_scf184850.g3 [Trametes cinnabarina]|uniref:BTB domain-containing protein n=1 Tax=Pycnoporus cinnabarinus TaxID=5643 RepID=A0A060SJK1_PYCCI|nr:hypothetical protein BN946_scf184850.g3 [Trametes cinnabarina]
MTAYDVGSSVIVRAADPFYSKDANVIVRSVDDVEFRVHKHLLKLAAPTLAALINLTACHTTSRANRTRRLVALPHTGNALDMFLRFVYPVPEPCLALEDIAALLEIAVQYGAAGVTARMRPHLLLPAHLETNPFAVYALASYAGLNKVARIAARRTLAKESPGRLAGMRLLQVAAHVRLLQYRQNCMKAAQEVAHAEGTGAVPSWIQMRSRRFCFLSQGGTCTGKRRTLAWTKALHGCASVSESWVDYMAGVRAALHKTLNPSVARDTALVGLEVDDADGGYRDGADGPAQEAILLAVGQLRLA